MTYDKAGASGLKWSDVENAFDMYQSRSIHVIQHEGFSTKNAEKYGYIHCLSMVVIKLSILPHYFLLCLVIKVLLGWESHPNNYKIEKSI